MRERQVSVTEVTIAHLERIAGAAALNAFLTVAEGEALEAARALDADPRALAELPLAGVPLAVKDLIDTRGIRTTYGSALFRDHVPDRTALCVDQLVAAGAVLVGKTNLHEFAWGFTSANVHFGAVVNPRRPDRTPGGSSGGNAAALAAGLAALALGTDTGGSIRVPSAACGTAGSKPPYGTVPTSGVFPLVERFDHVGPMARDVADCILAAVVLDDDLPSAIEPRLDGVDIGVLADGPHAEALVALGVRLVETELPPPIPGSDAFFAEAAHTHRALYPARADGYSEELRRKLDRGRRTLAVRLLADLAHLDAMRASAMESIPGDRVLVVPTLSGELPPAGPETPELRAAASRWTRPFNELGWPAVTCRDGLMFAGRSAALVLGAALAWEATLPPVEIVEIVEIVEASGMVG